jgi:hypothetical protein
MEGGTANNQARPGRADGGHDLGGVGYLDSALACIDDFDTLTSADRTQGINPPRGPHQN